MSDSRPANSDKIFIQLIVQVPVIPILAMLMGVMNLSLELPFSPFKKMGIYRSFVVRIVLLVVQTFFTILFYQVRMDHAISSLFNVFCFQGTNAALYSFIATVGYTTAQLRGEIMTSAKDNKGRGGTA